MNKLFRSAIFALLIVCGAALAGCVKRPQNHRPEVPDLEQVVQNDKHNFHCDVHTELSDNPAFGKTTHWDVTEEAIFYTGDMSIAWYFPVGDQNHVIFAQEKGKEWETFYREGNMHAGLEVCMLSQINIANDDFTYYSIGKSFELKEEGKAGYLALLQQKYPAATFEDVKLRLELQLDTPHVRKVQFEAQVKTDPTKPAASIYTLRMAYRDHGQKKLAVPDEIQEKLASFLANHK